MAVTIDPIFVLTSRAFQHVVIQRAQQTVKLKAP